jgi:CheY-like chemotaxis protein
VLSSWLPRREFAENRAQSARELGVGRAFGARPGPDKVSAARLELRSVFLQRSAQSAADTIAGDRVAYDPTDGKRDARGLWSCPDLRDSHLEMPGMSAAAACQRLKRRLTTDAPNQAERFARPLVRRRRITARPARLRIRSRKPCFFLRLRLFGWYVRFIHGLLDRPGRGKGPGAGARRVLSTRASGRQSLRAVREQRQSAVRRAPDRREAPTVRFGGVIRKGVVGFLRTLLASPTRASVRSPVDR